MSLKIKTRHSRGRGNARITDLMANINYSPYLYIEISFHANRLLLFISSD